MLQRAFLYVQKGIFSTSRIGIYLGVLALNSMMILVIADVFLRKFFAAPVRGSLELTEILLGIVIFLGLAFCAVKDEHVVIDIVVGRFSKRAKTVTMTIIHFLSAGVAGLMAWRLFLQALNLQRGSQVSLLLELPLYPFVLIAFIGCALMALVYILKLLSLFNGLEK